MISPDAKFSPYDNSAVLFNTLDTLFLTDKCVGYIAIFETDTINFQIIRRILSIGIWQLKDIVISAVKGYPVRLKSVIYWNSYRIVSLFHSLLFKPWLSAKINKRILIHSSGEPFDKIYDVIPKQDLPDELGGSAGSIKELSENWIKKMESFRELLILEENFKSDETKRLKK